MTTPATDISKAPHWAIEMAFFNMTIDNTAVVRMRNW
jgi:hypothetical protein